VNVSAWHRFLKQHTEVLGNPSVLAAMPVRPTHEMPKPFGARTRWVHAPFSLDLNITYKRNTVFGPEAPTEFLMRLKRSGSLTRINLVTTATEHTLNVVSDGEEEWHRFGKVGEQAHVFVERSYRSRDNGRPRWNINDARARAFIRLMIATLQGN